MRRRSSIGAAMAVLVLASAVRADPPEGAKVVDELRANLPKVVDLDGLRRNREKLAAATEDDLLLLRRDAEALTAEVLAKQRRIEVTKVMLRAETGSASVERGAQSALRLLAIDRDRKARVDDVLRRAEEAATRWNGGKPLEGVWPPKWLETDEAKQFGAEFQEVQAASRAALAEEKRRADSGASPAEMSLGEIEREAATELAEVTRLVVDVRRELVKRGRPDPTLPTAERDLERQREEERTADAARYRIRLAALRTEHEAKTGEGVDLWFRVWGGTRPYEARLRAPKSEQRVLERTFAEPGDHAVVVSYGKPGTYTARLEVADESGEWKGVDFTITVTGDPVPAAKPAVGRGGGTASGGGEPSLGTTSPILLAPPVPISGTFRAVMWLANAQLPRWDWDTVRDGAKVHGVPLTVTIDPTGRIEGKARYALPAAEMKPVADPTVTSTWWKVSFDLEGKVDWTTGKTSLRVTNGHDESGRTATRPSLGRTATSRSWSVADYSATLEGFSVPGPTASMWLAAMKNVPDVLKLDFEGRGIPTLVDGGAAGPQLRDRGFFGQATGDPSEPTPRAMVHTRFASGIEFEGQAPQEMDDTARENGYRQMEATGKLGSWYLKIVGPGTVDPPAPPPAVTRGDLLAFGLWPTTPITVRVGDVAKAEAMGVFSDDVDDAVDLSKASAWSATGGLVPLGDGAFRATAPGTFSITATHPGRSGPMSSTIVVRVAP